MSSPIQIAIADDSETDVHILRKIIAQNTAYAIKLVCRSGLELNDKFEFIQKNIDLVIVDWHMPLLNGCDTAALLVHKGYKGKILCVTYGFQRNYSSNLKEVGAHGFSSKNEQSLLKAMQAVLEGDFFYDNEENHQWERISKETDLSRKDMDETFSVLNKLEVKIIKALSKGYNSTEIGYILGLSKNTIEKYKSEIYKKTGAKNDKQLLSVSFIKGIIRSEDYFQ